MLQSDLEMCQDVTRCHLGDETIAVNAVVMNKLGKSRKPRLGSDKILEGKKSKLGLFFHGHKH